ncbi:hypothetical protein COHA_002154 [Chlorella ohadii]|uniref:phosphoserine transaminase n=1 Tax=Chlorella ohadii TaxID=2649997 RepID=A0AAD5H588_9CHLO|nr:hypothetical protein COHA_002154 [Chlorella ohadii]
MCIGSGCRPPGAPRPARRRSPGRRQFAVTQPARTSPSVAPCSLQLAVRAVAAEAASSTTGQPHGRVFNFSAGPAVLPVEVLEQAQADLLNWRGSGMSVMEMSHRGKEFQSIIDAAEADLRALLSIPDNYHVLFMQGGASTQFSAIPLNLAGEGDTVDYIVTGSWSKKAASEAKKYCKVNVAATGDNKSIPARDSWNLSADAKYVHYCDNETIQGVEFKGAPDVGGKVLIADMSSNFLSKPVDVSKYGIIYAGAQKNIGPAGVTIVIKAKVLYDAIAGSNGFYNSPVDPAVRSLMNVPFTIPSNPDLEKEFIAQAAKQGMIQLKGHRSVGGMRASIYNSMPLDGVQQLAAFMQKFAAQHAK